MGEIIKGIVLGIVQGITEFLPVSSSGHLEIAKYFLGENAIGEESLLMTVVLHFGTALATIFVFRKDILDIFKGLFKKGESQNFAIYIIISMIPAALVGLLFEDAIESMFGGNILFVCAMLIVTGILLYFADKAKDTGKKVGWLEALIIGIAQAIAITPGISRSGATISTSVLLGIDKARAARFSFLMVVPLIIGKIAKDLLDGEFSKDEAALLPLLAGFVVSFVVGYFACAWMIKMVKQSKLIYFSIYCLIVGVVGVILTYVQ